MYTNYPTQFIIKPDAYKKKEEILNFIQDKGYSIILTQDFTMTKEIFKGLYNGIINKNIIKGVFEYLMENYCVRIQSNISINDLLNLSGRNINPKLCSEGTIRKKFGAGKGFSKSGIEIIRNAVHRPKTLLQNKYQINLLRSYL
jgi:nucleoside diphosphate kinase